MNHRLFSTFFIFIAVLAAGQSLASEEFCIKFHDITGGGGLIGCDSAASRAYEYHHLASRELDNGVPGPLRHQLIIVTKRADQADLHLWQRLDSGTVIQEVLIESPTGGGGGRSPFRWTLTNARIIGLEPIIPHTGDPDHSLMGDQIRIRMDYQSLLIQSGGDEYTITP